MSAMMKWFFMLPLLTCVGLFVAAWLIHRPVKRLEEFCANIPIGESQAAVHERARTARFDFQDSHKPQEVIQILVDNSPMSPFAS